jgi:hypothetical protein
MSVSGIYKLVASGWKFSLRAWGTSGKFYILASNTITKDENKQKTHK